MRIANLLAPLKGTIFFDRIVGFSIAPKSKGKKDTLRLTVLNLQPNEKREIKAKIDPARNNIDLFIDGIRQEFSFLGTNELRPGSGIVRVSGGVPEGPGGTLTCFLSSRDGRDTYFMAAGHVLSNFWTCKCNPESSIFLNRKGYPSATSSRFLGNLVKPESFLSQPVGSLIYSDIGIVKLAGDVELKQRTTGFGSLGEWPPDEPGYVRRGQCVMKCGAEETHWTEAKVEQTRYCGWVYGPEQKYFVLNQVLLRALSEDEDSEGTPPNNSKATPFAISGDSGSLVVEQETKRPVGMLIAGSVLEGRYIMTPIRTLYRFWTRPKLDLILLRA